MRVRESHWTESIAVGSREFVEKNHSQLSIRVDPAESHTVFADVSCWPKGQRYLSEIKFTETWNQVLSGSTASSGGLVEKTGNDFILSKKIVRSAKLAVWQSRHFLKSSNNGKVI